MDIVGWVIGVGAAGMAVGGLIWSRSLSQRMTALQLKKEQLEKITMDDVGDIMRTHEQQIRALEQEIAQKNEEIRELHQRVDGAIQHTSVVRYNPFRDTGGDQSFAAAFLDQRGDGVIISSLHSRTSTRVYAKPIVSGSSQFELTDEEMNALARAVRHDSEAQQASAREEEESAATISTM